MPAEGFVVGDELLRQLADIKTDGNIVPPSLFVEKRHIAGADYAVITVLPCDTPPVRYYSCALGAPPRFGESARRAHPQRAAASPRPSL